jgi:hypothetical protein
VDGVVILTTLGERGQLLPFAQSAPDMSSGEHGEQADDRHHRQDLDKGESSFAHFFLDDATSAGPTRPPYEIPTRSAGNQLTDGGANAFWSGRVCVGFTA